MIIELDLVSDKPIHEQLALVLKRDIVTGDLPLGGKLPSVRNLAADIGINMHTVNKVYKRLEAEGILVKKIRGFIVNSAGFEKTPKAINQFEQKLYDIHLEQQLYKISDAELLEILEKFRRDK